MGMPLGDRRATVGKVLSRNQRRRQERTFLVHANQDKPVLLAGDLAEGTNDRGESTAPQLRSHAKPKLPDDQYRASSIGAEPA